MTDTKQPEALRLSLSISLMDTFTNYQQEELDKAAAELRRQHARIAELEAQLESIGAGGVSGPLMGQPQEMPDLTTLTERGAKAWAGVDAQGLREGVASAGGEPVARADSWTNDQWIDLAQRHANADWDSDTPDGYLNAVKALCNDFAAANHSPPEGMVGGWNGGSHD